MAIKSDVLEHLMTHPNEVVSLTALASKLDVTLEQVRSAVSSLRSGAVRQGSGVDKDVAMRDSIRIVSRGYAVKYIPSGDDAPSSPEPTPTPADVPNKSVKTTVTSGSDDRPAAVEVTMTDSDEAVIPVGVNHPHSNDVEVVLGQLGPTAHKVFSYIAQQGGMNVTGDDVVEATGLTRSAVTSAFYNTLFNTKQLNRNARRLFVKVGKDVYRMSLPGDGVIVGPSPKHSGLPAELPKVPTTVTQSTTFTRTPVKVDTPTSPPADDKRIFEELRVLLDGSVLIEDEDGRVYKAREV